MGTSDGLLARACVIQGVIVHWNGRRLQHSIVKVLKWYVSKPRPVKRAFAGLERLDGKLSRAVLRGRGASNGPLLPDWN